LNHAKWQIACKSDLTLFLVLCFTLTPHRGILRCTRFYRVCELKTASKQVRRFIFCWQIQDTPPPEAVAVPRSLHLNNTPLSEANAHTANGYSTDQKPFCLADSVTALHFPSKYSTASRLRAQKSAGLINGPELFHHPWSRSRWLLPPLKLQRLRSRREGRASTKQYQYSTVREY
jgi:hypothetical protein